MCFSGDIEGDHRAIIIVINGSCKSHCIILLMSCHMIDNLLKIVKRNGGLSGHVLCEA